MDDPLLGAELLGRFRRQPARLLAPALAGLVLGLVQAAGGGSPYTATAYLAVARPDPAVHVRPPAAEETTVNAANDAGLTRLAQSRAYAELVDTPGIAALVLQALGDRAPAGAGPLDLLRLVRTRALAEGALIQLEAHGASPDAAADLANTWASTFSAHIESLFGNEGDARAAAGLAGEAASALATAEAGVAAADTDASRRERDLAAERYTALARRAAELTLSPAIARPEVRVASTAVAPADRDWPRLARWPALGLVLGLFLGLVWVLAPERAPRAPRRTRPGESIDGRGLT